jgi:dTDP-4-dehydrorhamnose 3,5-epimerase
MQRFKINKTSLLDLFIVDLKPLKDNRGYLKRLYCNDQFINIMSNKPISQINYTFTKKKGSVRGLHYQIKPFSEKKIITCIKGEVYDVAVDLRKNSPTFLKYFSIILSEKNNKMIVIPEGFAHGFQTLKDNCEMMYFHSKSFNAKSERGINSLDPKLNIKWPLNFTQISDKDKNHTFLKIYFKGV